MMAILAVRSKVSFVQKASRSVKTIIPRGAAEVLKVTDGDELEWEISAENGKIIVKVRKVD